MAASKKKFVKVSVLLTAKNQEELKAKVQELKQQDYPNFEIITTLGGTITRGTNRAMRRAKGKIIVFTETDVAPLSRSWLSELVAEVRPGEVVKGLEIPPPGFNLCNTACFAEIAQRFPMNEKYLFSFDTEWSKRLARHGIPVRMVYTAGVLHLRGPVSEKALKRAYQYGREWVRLAGEGLFEEFPSLHEQTRRQIAVGQANLRGMRDEIKRLSAKHPLRKLIRKQR